MQLTKQQKQVLWERIDEILFYKYDPIEIWDLPIVGVRDEYSGYVPEVLDLAISSVDYQPVKKHLIYLAEDSMARPISEEKAEHLGRLIYSLVHSENPATNSDDYQMESSLGEVQNPITRLQELDKEEDQCFIQAFLRAKYAVTIRQRQAGSKNEDFEKIGTRFHNWFRDNLKLVGLDKDSQEDFNQFVNQHFKYYLDAYLRIAEAKETLVPGLESVHYIQQWGIAASLRDPLLLAALLPTDSVELANEKINTVAKYIDIFCVRRSINFTAFGATSIRYTMYTLVKELRDLPLDELKAILQNKLDAMDETWDKFQHFRLHGQNKRFVKYLLSRISGYVDQLAGQSSNFTNYYHKGVGKPYEVEHLWSNHFDAFKDEFEQQSDFEEYRNRLGGLVLLPSGTNQSYGGKPYSEKKQHYVKENLLVKSLCSLAYENNPNFKKLITEHELPFKAHDEFKKQDLEERQALYQGISENIWSL